MPPLHPSPAEDALHGSAVASVDRGSQPASPLWAERVAQTILLTVLLLVPAIMTLRGGGMGDYDIWWHLRAGEWISAHHAVPHIESFSRPAAGTLWVDYSWLFELLVFRLFHAFGLVGLLIYPCLLLSLITAALCRLVHRAGTQLPAAAGFTIVCMLAMGHLFTPRPWLFTILFFICELSVLMHARATGNRSDLLWLPPLFLLWANIHIQFVYGLAVLALAAAEAVSARWWDGAQKKIGPGAMLAAFVASALATLANPYGWRLYAVIRDLASESGALSKISELQAIPFRDASAYIVLLFALGSAALLGRERRLVSFEGGLLLFAAYVSFKSQRDVWVLVVIAALILRTTLPRIRTEAGRAPAQLSVVAFVLAALAFPLACRALRVNNSALAVRLADHLPVRAVETIARNHYPGPIFNGFDWGGYLIWALREPVSIDGRQNVYGDQRLDRSVATWAGAPGWASDPDLAAAGVVIGSPYSPLSQLLLRDSRFQLAYQDSVAVVFIPRTKPTAP